MNDLNEFSESLKDLMSEQNLSVQALAKSTGIGFPNLYCYLRAERLPSVETAIVLATISTALSATCLVWNRNGGQRITKHARLFTNRLPF